MITFQPDSPPLFNPNVMIACLRGRVPARKVMR